MRSPSAARTKTRSGSKHNIRSQLGRKSSKSSDELTALVRKSSKSSDELKVLVRKSSKSSDELQSSKSSDIGASSDCEDDSPRNQTSHEEDVKPSAPVAAPVAPVDSSEFVARAENENEDPEARLKKQLTKLRARMQAMVLDAQAEAEYVLPPRKRWTNATELTRVYLLACDARTLRSLLKSEKQSHERRERQLRVEANAKQYALEVLSPLDSVWVGHLWLTCLTSAFLQERHASAKERMSAKVTRLSSQISHLQVPEAPRWLSS